MYFALPLIRKQGDVFALYIFTARKSMTATPKRKTLDYSEEQSSIKKKRKNTDDEEQTDDVEMEVGTIFY